jgi:hypothetical protein
MSAYRSGRHSFSTRGWNLWQRLGPSRIRTAPKRAPRIQRQSPNYSSLTLR